MPPPPPTPTPISFSHSLSFPSEPLSDLAAPPQSNFFYINILLGKGVGGGVSGIKKRVKNTPLFPPPLHSCPWQVSQHRSVKRSFLIGCYYRGHGQSPGADWPEAEGDGWCAGGAPVGDVLHHCQQEHLRRGQECHDTRWFATGWAMPSSG